MLRLRPRIGVRWWRLRKLLTYEPVEWWRALLRSVPGELGCCVRNTLYGFGSSSGVRVLSHVIIYHPRGLSIGPNTNIAAYCQLNAAGTIKIGTNVLVGPGAAIWSENHNFKLASVPIRMQGYRKERVIIDDDVWVGAGAIVLPGVHLATGTVVAAGAVVTHSTEKYTVVAGVPAQPIGKRSFSSERVYES